MNKDTDNQYHEDEIDLIEILSVLGKRKILILVITTISILAGVLFAFTSPEVYELHMAIEPGVVDITPDGKKIYIDSVSNIKGKIESDIYTDRIRKSLGLKATWKPKFKLKIPRGSNVIRVDYEARKDKIGLGVEVLKQLYAKLQKGYETDIRRRRESYNNEIFKKQSLVKDLEVQKEDIGKEISAKLNSVKNKKNQIELEKYKIKILDQREKALFQELKDAEVYTDNIIRQRQEFLKESTSTPRNKAADLLYAVTVQQKASLLNELKNQLEELKIKQERSRISIKTLKNDIDNLFLEIDKLKLKKTEALQSKINSLNAEITELKQRSSYIHNIKIIQPPTVTPEPIKPRKLLDIVLSAFLGLMLAVFVAFFAEFLSNVQKNRASDLLN